MAKIANMTAAYNLRALRPSQELPSSSASQLNNAFKPVFQQALENGAISITRNRIREAVLLSAELYDQVLAELAARDPLKLLREQYDARFAAMQTAKSRKSHEVAFDAGLGELAKAAEAEAAGKR